jgi:hypothetical protein
MYAGRRCMWKEKWQARAVARVQPWRIRHRAAHESHSHTAHARPHTRFRQLTYLHDTTPLPHNIILYTKQPAWRKNLPPKR